MTLETQSHSSLIWSFGVIYYIYFFRIVMILLITGLTYKVLYHHFWYENVEISSTGWNASLLIRTKITKDGPYVASKTIYVPDGNGIKHYINNDNKMTLVYPLNEEEEMIRQDIRFWFEVNEKKHYVTEDIYEQWSHNPTRQFQMNAADNVISKKSFKLEHPSSHGFLLRILECFVTAVVESIPFLLGCYALLHCV